jgi:hypothetical protein
MEHPHPANCRQSKQIIMLYQKKSKSTITNDKRTSISNPNKTQIRILLHCLGSSHKRKHQLARKGAMHVIVKVDWISLGCYIHDVTLVWVK